MALVLSSTLTQLKGFEMAEIEHMFAELQETMSSIRMKLSAEESIKDEGIDGKRGCHRM